MSTTYQNSVNLAHGNKFKFVISKIPTTVFYAVDFQTPSITATAIKLPYKQHYTNVGADKIEYGELSVTFKIDEGYANYVELLTWIEGIGKPHSYDERQALVDSNKSTRYQKGEHLIASDASIIILDNQSIPISEIKFKNIFPTSLSGINFTTKTSDAQPLEATVTLAIESMSFGLPESL